MDEQRWHFAKVGMVVVASFILTGILVVMFSDTLSRRYTVYIHSDQAPGVTKDTPIRKHGITIGRVSRVKVEDDGVLLTCSIDTGKSIYEDEVCVIKTASFLGDAELAFFKESGANELDRKEVSDGERVRKVKIARNPLEIVDVVLKLEKKAGETLNAVEGAAKSLTETSDTVGQITSLVRDVVVDNKGDFQSFIKNAQRISNKSELAIDNFNSVMSNVDKLVGNRDVQGNIVETVKRIPQLVAEAEKTVKEVRTLIDPFKKVGEKAELNLEQLSAFTKSLGSDGPVMIADVKKSLAKIDTFIAELGEVSKQLKNPKGTVGKLLNDPAAYNSLLASLENVERITTQIQPLVSDFRLFADSLARNPSQLGLRGVFQRTTGGGSKGGGGLGNGRIGNRFFSNGSENSQQPVISWPNSGSILRSPVPSSGSNPATKLKQHSGETIPGSVSPSGSGNTFSNELQLQSPNSARLQRNQPQTRASNLTVPAWSPNR